MVIEQTEFWGIFLAIIIPTGIALFVIFFTQFLQTRTKRKQIFNAIKNEVFDNAVLLKAIQEDLNLELKHVTEEKYSMTSFMTLQIDSWLLLKTSTYLFELEKDQYLKIMRYYAYARNLNSIIEFRNNYVNFQVTWTNTPKKLEGIDNDIQYRIGIVIEKQKEIEQVLQKLL